MRAQLSTLLTLFQVGAFYFFLQLQVPNRLVHGGRGRLADPALEGRRSFIVTAQQDTSKLPLAAVSDSEEERSGWGGGEEVRRRPQSKHGWTTKNKRVQPF